MIEVIIRAKFGLYYYLYDHVNSRNITDISLYAPIMPILDKDESTPYIL